MSNRLFIRIAVLLVIGRLILAFGQYHPDVWNNMDWGTRFFEYGASKFYAPESNVWSYTWPNQPPGTILLFAVVRKVFEATFGGLFLLNTNLSFFPSFIFPFLEQMLYPFWLKSLSILFDVGIAYLIYKITKSKFITLVWLINPVVWYNSSIWGQTDSIINFFALLSFYLLPKKKYFFAFLAFSICLYIKFSLIFFLPVLVIALFKERVKVRSLILPAVFAAIPIICLTLLFSYPKEPVSWLVNLYSERILREQLHVITANSFNLWALIAGINEQPHSKLLGPLSYQFWGLILFGLTYAWSLCRFLRSKEKTVLWWTLATIAFSSWMLLTNMHERYLYPLFPYLTILLATRKELFVIYATTSVISLLNLYNYWFVPPLTPLISLLSFGDKVFPRFLGLVNLSLFILFLRQWKVDRGKNK